VFFNVPFDALLTIQVKRSGRSSDEALGLDHDWLGACTLEAGFDGRTLHSIPFADNNYLFAFQIHCATPSSRLFS
jgi:hypothetical protein